MCLGSLGGKIDALKKILGINNVKGKEVWLKIKVSDVFVVVVVFHSDAILGSLKNLSLNISKRCTM